MKANKFVKKFGWNEVISELSKTQDSVVVMWLGSQSNDYALVKDLKRLVESHELVKEHGSIVRAKMYAESTYTAPEVVDRLKQAIADVENCIGVSE